MFTYAQATLHEGFSRTLATIAIMHTGVHQAKSGLIAAMTVFLVVDAVIITARVYVRTFMIRAFGWDDATLCLAYVCAIIHPPCSCTRRT